MLNKRNLKEERGITLLALIITIIILAILALITISSAYMSGIIQFGVNGAKDYAQSAIEENRIMEETGNYVESVTKKIKVLLGEEPPTLPELTGMDWFVKGVTQPAEESKEVADFYAKGQPDGTLIIYPKNGVEATIEYVELEIPGPGARKFSIPSWCYDEKTASSVADIISVYVAKGMKASTCENLFSGLSNCTNIDLANLDTSQATDMSFMFFDCSSLENIDLTGLDTGKVFDMSSMFQNCSSLFNIDLSGLDTQQVQITMSMFAGCSALERVNMKGLNLSLVVTMSSMFSRCSSLQSIDLSGVDASQVENLGNMFAECHSLTSLDLSGFSTSNVKSLLSMFINCSGLTDLNLGNLDTGHNPDITQMFYGCSRLNSSMTLKSEPSATDISLVFRNCCTEPRFIIYIKLYWWLAGGRSEFG